jgi:tocopherol O-methyltransferase
LTIWQKKIIVVNMAKKHLQEDIISYYDTCETNYRRWWDLDRSLAMHAGFWDETTKTLHQALMRENEILADIAKIKPGEHVLDAGCGVGGSSLYLASQRKAHVTGITLSKNQVQLAQQKAMERKDLHPIPQFLVMDYTKTTFSDESFDVVWGLESVCHAEDKRDFIKEAWRVLKPNGRLIIADGFSVRNNNNEPDNQLLKKAVNGWAVNSMESIPNFTHFLTELNFKNIVAKDATPYVLPSSKRLYYYSFPAIAWSFLGEYLGWSNSTRTNDFKSYHYQYHAVKKELCKYMIFYAEKSNTK